jgi:hypothetical protein
MKQAWHCLVAFGALAAAVPALSSEPKDEREQAYWIYESLVENRTRFQDLTREQLLLLRELELIRRDLANDRRSPRERCIDREIDRLSAEPTRLDLVSIDLKCSQR